MTGLLGQIPQLLAIASFISIASSTIYELGYFSVIGFVFFPVLSPSDFVFSFLFWMPLIALTGAAAIVFSLSPALKTTSKSSSKGVPKFFIGLYEWTSVRCSGQLRDGYLTGSLPLLPLVATSALAIATILFQFYLDKIVTFRSPLAITVIALSAGGLIFIWGWSNGDDDLKSFLIPSCS
jgi:hypothetical protein